MSLFQAEALANAVFAYATHIDDLGKLTDAVQIIAYRHVSFQIPKHSYDDVGAELLKAIKEVLNCSDEIIEAWGQAYSFLAGILQATEDQMKQEMEKNGGWIEPEPLKLGTRILTCFLSFFSNSDFGF